MNNQQGQVRPVEPPRELPLSIKSIISAGESIIPSLFDNPPVGMSRSVDDTSFHTFSLSSGLCRSSWESSSPTMGSEGNLDCNMPLTIPWDPNSRVVTVDFSSLVPLFS